MIGIYFRTTTLPVRYLIYIAMTALARVLIEIGGAEHKTGTDLLIVAAAILVLSFAVLVLRFASPKDDASNALDWGAQTLSRTNRHKGFDLRGCGLAGSPSIPPT